MVLLTAKYLTPISVVFEWDRFYHLYFWPVIGGSIRSHMTQLPIFPLKRLDISSFTQILTFYTQSFISYWRKFDFVILKCHFFTSKTNGHRHALVSVVLNGIGPQASKRLDHT